VVGVDRTPPNEEERQKFPYRESYVFWQEEVAPLLIVELLSPGTAKEDLGRFAAADPEALALDAEAESTPENSRSNRESPPSKWEVYESYLRVPYYVVFNEKTARVRLFRHWEGAYQEVHLDANNPRIWIEELGIGLGVWRGEYEGVTCAWLRWYDAEGNWIPTEEEAERQLREQAQADAEEARAAEQKARAAEQKAKTEAQQAIEQLQQAAKNLLRSGIDAQQVSVLLGLDIELVRQLEAEN
jgi:Putative restriction endonuclease